MNDINDMMLLAIPAITGIVQAIKMAGLPSKWCGLLGVALGVASSFLLPDVNILWGLLFGLASVGLYSAPKNTQEAITE